MCRFVLSVFVTIAILFSDYLNAQTLFFKRPPSESLPLPSSLYGVDSEFAIEIDIRELVANRKARESYRLLGVDGREHVFKKLSVEFETGFIFQEDLQDIVPDPKLPNSSLSYSWSGLSNKQTLTFSVYNGFISGTLIGDQGKNYQITQSRQGLRWQRFQIAKFPRFEPDDERGVSAPNIATPIAQERSASSDRFQDAVSVLVLSTPQARNGAGTQAVLDSWVTQAINDFNQAMRNSNIESVRLTNVSSPVGSTVLTREIPISEFNETNFPPLANCSATSDNCIWAAYRAFLRTSSWVQDARNAADADIVVLLVNYALPLSTFPPPTLGIAYTQRADCGINFAEEVFGCNVGAAYSNFAFSVVSAPHMNTLQVFTHEVGHQFGMEHPTSGSKPSFPWSFAHFAVGEFETLMSTVGYADPNFCACQKRLQYSNPNVPFLLSNSASGTPLRYNAYTATQLAPAMSDFRNPQLVDLIFRVGFEELPLP